MSFRHKAVYGTTGMGKTTLIKERVRHYLAHKQQVVVFPGTGDTSFPKGCRYVWGADEMEGVLNDPERFGSFIVIDEGAALYGDVSRKRHPMVASLFMRGRHRGFTAWIATQFPTSIPNGIRLNCNERYIFAIADDHQADLIWRDCGRILWQGKPLRDAILQLRPYQYFRYIHPGELQLF